MRDMKLTFAKSKPYDILKRLHRLNLLTVARGCTYSNWFQAQHWTNQNPILSFSQLHAILGMWKALAFIDLCLLLFIKMDFLDQMEGLSTSNSVVFSSSLSMTNVVDFVIFGRASHSHDFTQNRKSSLQPQSPPDTDDDTHHLPTISAPIFGSVG
jgi:hypothetical protein